MIECDEGTCLCWRCVGKDLNDLGSIMGGLTFLGVS